MNADIIKNYQVMLTIRIFEEAICPYIENGEIKTPCHLYIGQEAIATGVCESLIDEDLIWGNHRSHGHYIAKGGNIQALMDEIFCKESGCSKGRGGSMHVFDKEKGILGTVPIVAATIPLAVGAALKIKLNNEDLVSVSFMGDGATEEGHVYESMNIAALYNLPILFVIENNLYSSHMHMEERRKQHDLQKLGESLGIPTKKIDGNDLKLVEKNSKTFIDDIRGGKGPAILECMTYRWRGHVGPSWDEDVGLKRKDELKDWKVKDPILREKNRLISLGVEKNKLKKIEEEVKINIDQVISKSLNSSFPDPLSILEHTFAK